MRGDTSLTERITSGMLNQRIAIGYTDNYADVDGYPTGADHVIARCWAYVRDGGRQDFDNAGTHNAEIALNFTVRWRTDVKPGMWIDFRGERYTISALGYHEFRKKYLGMKAAVVRGAV